MAKTKEEPSTIDSLTLTTTGIRSSQWKRLVIPIAISYPGHKFFWEIPAFLLLFLSCLFNLESCHVLSHVQGPKVSL